MLKTPKTKIRACLGLTALLALSGCGMDEVKVPASLVGPSELGISLQFWASPDVVNADGVSQSLVSITVRDQNGKPLAGKQLAVVLESGDGAIVAGGVLVGPLQTGLTVASGSNGIAQVVYQAGYSVGVVRISARPFGFDTNGTITRWVEIWQM